LTVREVAARLRISTATVYALCRAGQLEHHRVSNAIRISERGLAEYVEEIRAMPSATR
jgi:excisionase family DNA binding protein